MKPTEEWLKRVDRKLERQQVPPKLRPVRAIVEWSKHTKTVIELYVEDTDKSSSFFLICSTL